MTAVPVLAYHAVSRHAGMPPALFEQHLQVLSRVAGPSLHPEQLPAARAGFLLTFDDGFSDLWTHGLDRLEQHDLRATVFVISARTGEGEERPRGVTTWSGSESLAHAEAGDGAHPAFLRWSELAALEASGRVRVGSHSLHHRIGWVSDRPRGFHLAPTTHWGLGQANGGDVRLGVPVFRRGSALAHRLFHDAPEVRDSLCDWVAERGGEAYVLERGVEAVSRELLACWERLTRNGAAAGRWESEVERLERTHGEISGSLSLLRERLGGPRVEFCLPWGEYDDTTLRLARDAGCERVYTLRRRPNRAREIGSLVHRFEPRARGPLWLRSRLWIYRSTWRAALYGRLGGRA